MDLIWFAVARHMSYFSTVLLALGLMSYIEVLHMIKLIRKNVPRQ